MDRLPNMSVDAFQAYVSIDAATECHGALNDEEICAAVKGFNDSDSDNELNDDDDDDAPLPTSNQALLSLNVLRRYVETKCPQSLDHFYKLESAISKEAVSEKKQQAILDYFK